MTIAQAEDFIIGECRTLLGSGVSVEGGPGELSGAYLKNFLTDLPAVRVVFDGLEARDSTALYVDMVFSVLVIVGWTNEGEEARRRASALRGAYPIMECIAARLHNSDSWNPTSRVTGQEYVPGRIRVEGIENRWEAPMGSIDVAAYAVMLNMDAQIDDECPMPSVLDDFLRAGVDFDLDEDAASDLEGDFDLPQ